MAYKHHKRYHSNDSFITWFLGFILYIVIALPLLLMYWGIKAIILVINKKTSSKPSAQVVNDDQNYDLSIKNNYKENKNKYDNGLILYNQKESLVTNYERYFYDIFEKHFGTEYKIQTQVNLASIVDKTDKSKYRNELFRNIDFGFFDKKTLKPLLLVEINDSTHKTKSRYERDLKVRDILTQARIKLITFYSSYDNKEEYVISKIRKALAE